MTIALLLLATSCRQHRGMFVSTRHADSVERLNAIRLTSLDSEEWEQTVILRADSTGLLVPSEAVVHHRTTRHRTGDTSAVVTETVVEQASGEETDETTRIDPPEVEQARRSRFEALLLVALLTAVTILLLTDKKERQWKSRN